MATRGRDGGLTPPRAAGTDAKREAPSRAPASRGGEQPGGPEGTRCLRPPGKMLGGTPRVIDETGDLFARAEAAPRPLSVGELTRRLKAAVEPGFRDVWVAGEVANLRRQSSGHFYFSLKDEEATIGAVLWASRARRVRFDLAEGQQVLARGFVEIYSPHGKYQLVVQEIEPRGAGAKALLLQQVKERLKEDGLLDPARKRPLPFLPRRVGVATSRTGAALRDFLRVLHARFPGIPVLVAPCRVQGEGAAQTVIWAMRALCRAGVDVIVVARGGGSQEELWEFNDERLARAVAACPVAVVSAVGHETDVTVVDLVADVRAATPTHAAQLVAPVRDELAGRLAALRGRLARAAAAALDQRRRDLRALRAELADPARLLSKERHRVDDLLHCAKAAVRAPPRRERARLDALRARLGRLEPRAHLRDLRARAEAAARRLGAWQAATFRREELRLERLRARLEPANVTKLLARGFALVLQEARLVTGSADVAPGEAIRIALSRGWLDARVEARDRGDDPLPGRADEDPDTGLDGAAVDPLSRPR